MAKILGKAQFVIALIILSALWLGVSRMIWPGRLGLAVVGICVALYAAFGWRKK